MTKIFSKLLYQSVNVKLGEIFISDNSRHYNTLKLSAIYDSTLLTVSYALVTGLWLNHQVMKFQLFVMVRHSNSSEVMSQSLNLLECELGPN